MGNILSAGDQVTTLKSTYDTEKVTHDKSLDLSNGDTVVKQKLTVTGTSAFNDDITLATGKKINGIDVATLNANLGTLQTSVSGMGTAVSGDFTGKAITGTSSVTSAGIGNFAGGVTSAGPGTFNSLTTTNIDINGNITSSAGKKYITSDTASGLKFTNGLASTDANYNYQSFDAASGDINIYCNKNVTIGNNNGTPMSKVNMVNGNVTCNSLKVNLYGIKDITGKTFLSPSTLDFGGTTILNATSLAVPTITTTGLVTSKGLTNTGAITNTGDLSNTGALNNTGALKIGTSKWLINEVVDATKGTRLCFGAENASGVATYWTCMNNVGNLERF